MSEGQAERRDDRWRWLGESPGRRLRTLLVLAGGFGFLALTPDLARGAAALGAVVCALALAGEAAAALVAWTRARRARPRDLVLDLAAAAGAAAGIGVLGGALTVATGATPWWAALLALAGVAAPSLGAVAWTARRRRGTKPAGG